MNIPSIIIAAVIGVIFVAIIVREIRNKKKGKSTCSCGCGGCAMSGMCHSEKQNTSENG